MKVRPEVKANEESSTQISETTGELPNNFKVVDQNTMKQPDVEAADESVKIPKILPVLKRYAYRVEIQKKEEPHRPIYKDST